MASRTIPLTDALHEYMLSVSVHEPEILKALRRETEKLSNSLMQISPEQGQFMRFLIGLTGARKGIEIGVFTGYSALSVALAMPKDGKLIACDVNEEWTSVARRYWKEAGVSDKIDLRLQPALKTLDELLALGEAETFDYAFIDADKVNQGNYYEKVLRLVRRGGLIALDNTLWNGNVYDLSINDPDTRAIREHNEFLYTDQRVNMCMVPIGEGLTLAIKR